MTVTTLMTCHDDRVASSRYDIDQAIRKHEEEVRGLKYKRNALAITSSLPPEILCKIFMFVVEACSAHARPSSRLNWIKVCHVSRHWRAVALECPTLWSNIVFTTAGAAQEMIKRSKAAPLSIRVDFDLMTPKMVQAVQKALVHMQRTTHLHFTATGGTMDKLMTSLEQPARALESLFVANTYPSENYKNNRYNFPSSFLSGEAPNLRELELQRCSIPWDSSLFSRLHHLKIADPGVDNRPTADQLLDLLEKAYTLKSLALIDCLPVMAQELTAAPVPERTVMLPSLSTILLSGTTVECANLLNYLSVSSTTCVKLVCTDTGDYFSALTSALARTLDQIGIKRLHIQSLGDTLLRIQAWTTSDSDNKVPKSQAHVDLELSWKHYAAGGAERIVKTICKGLPLNHVRILHVWQMDTLLQKDAWVSIFGSLPKLRTIDLHGHKAADFIGALNASCEVPTIRGTRKQKSSPARTSMLFPGLRHILFNNVDFRMNEANTLIALHDALFMRAECGADIRDVGLCKCSNISEQDINNLREVLVDIRWDGLDLESDDEDGFYSDEGFFPPVYRSFQSAYDDLEDFLSPGP